MIEKDYIYNCIEAGIDINLYGSIFCFCDCHRDDEDILHFMSCCKLCYEKYINIDDSLDTNRLKELIDVKQNGISKKDQKGKRRKGHRKLK